MSTKTITSHTRILTLIVGIFLPVADALAGPSSNFDDATAQGWTPIVEPWSGDPFGGTIEVIPTGGNPGGFLRARDTVNGGGYMILGGPAEFRGDLRGYSSLAWDDYLYDHGTVENSTRAFIIGPDNTTFWYHIPPIQGLEIWQSHDIALVESEWTRGNGTMSFDDVMANGWVTFQMSVNTGAPPALEAGIDNIRLVPEPVTSCLVLCGAAFVLRFTRRK